ncbi:Nucleotide-binding universal stress protein, UspA family [Halogeometricum rufum]|uniref:Nucleotide-binding universal stress protein, UspA family n=1 Tax=Halogeometricum rufum TaxID=553469 RepID=A0A1I6FUI8_9EURY|nr:universal stress protein [Halogeometricum rufum]SFR33600.1 Nucleotide-binding universal stress protein, UspA family [Halogeometricum rufum]
MALLVPFDGSELAAAALTRATQFGYAFDEDTLAVSVIPDGNVEYARERGWLDAGEAFDRETVVSRLHERVADRSPSADFQYEAVDRYATPGTIANRLRKVARREEASMVFVGSENAGHIVTTLSSVGSRVAADGAYDVVVVRHRQPREIPALSAASEHRTSEPRVDRSDED